MTTNDTNYAATAMSDNELDAVVGGAIRTLGTGIILGALFGGIAGFFPFIASVASHIATYRR